MGEEVEECSFCAENCVGWAVDAEYLGLGLDPFPVLSVRMAVASNLVKQCTRFFQSGHDGRLVADDVGRGHCLRVD